ncbi:MAG: M56 family metallopeptidase [Isosphaerales bacterium]
MNPTDLTTSPVWTAAGWTMLHLVWVGAAIGLAAALARRLLKTARPEARYGVALACLFSLSVSPAAIFVRVFEADSGPEVAIVRAVRTSEPASSGSSAISDQPRPARPEVRGVAVNPPISDSRRSRLDFLVPYLPWFWLAGSLSTLVMLATGLIGVEQLRRSSRLVEAGDLPRRCRALAGSLGIARRVGVGVCNRLAVPVLMGIVRPLVLLPPAALSGWSALQLEMVLLHELAHLRRWDNFVNLLQRVVESLLFFHPVVWWLSGWVRLERELCCDRLVVQRLGQPFAYAEMLVTLAGSSHRGRPTVLAMADRQVMTRIRRLFNLEDRSMKLTMPEGLGLLGAVIVGASVVLGSHAAQPKRVSDPDEMIRQVPGKAVDDVKDIPVPGAPPGKAAGLPVDTTDPSAGPMDIPVHGSLRGRGAGNASNSTPPPTVPLLPASQRVTSLFPRDVQRLEIRLLARTSDGVETWICRGGIKILTKAPKFGTIEIEADGAVIERGPDRKVFTPVRGRKGETWVDHDERPMKVSAKGNVVLRQDQNSNTGKGDRWTLRATQLDYDFETGRWLALDAEIEVAASGALTPSKITCSRIEYFGAPVRQPNGSFAPAEHSEIRAGNVASPEPTGLPSPSTADRDSKGSEP